MKVEHIHAVLADIQKRVPAHLRKNVVREIEATPTIRMVMEKAVEMESLSPEKRESIKTLLDKGEFSKKMVIEDPKIAKMIEQFVSREINKEIKAGNLPNRKQLKVILENEKNNNRSSEGENKA